MYSRSYEASEGVKIPTNYDGTAFTPPGDTEPPAEGGRAEEAGAFSHGGGQGGLFSSLFDKFPIASFLPKLGFPELSRLKMPEIHGEEILIICVALFLLFSKNGDKECAVMLLILLLF